MGLGETRDLRDGKGFDLWGDMTYHDTLGQMGSAFLPIASCEGSLEWLYTWK